MKLPMQAYREIIYEPVVSYDLFPTILNALGAKYNIKNIDGKDLNNLFFKKSLIENTFLYIFLIITVVSGNQVQRLEIRVETSSIYEENTKKLYNLYDDFSESNNLADTYPEIVDNLSKKMEEIKLDLNANKTTINQNYKK